MSLLWYQGPLQAALRQPGGRAHHLPQVLPEVRRLRGRPAGDREGLRGHRAGRVQRGAPAVRQHPGHGDSLHLHRRQV